MPRLRDELSSRTHTPMPKKTLKERIEENAVVIFCGALIAGFAAGFGAYKVLLEISGKDVVAKDSYVLVRDLPKPSEAKVDIPPSDPAADNIQRYYKLLNDHQYEDAWLLLHRNRRAELQKVLPNWEAFAHRFDTTRGHENFRIDLEKRDLGTLFYWVSFDVKDSVPKCDLYEYRDRLAKDLFATGVLNKDRTLELVSANLGIYYDTSALAATDLEKIVSQTRVESLFSPMFIFELASDLKLSERPNFPLAPMRDVWRHFILEVKMRQDDNVWKIADGLTRPAAVGSYDPTSRIPSK
jgi:hypothetical protein